MFRYVNIWVCARLCLISASACVNRGEADERKPKTAPHCLLDRGLEVSRSSEK